MKFNINGKQKFGAAEKGKATAEQVIAAFNGGKQAGSRYEVSVRQRGEQEFAKVGSKAVPVDEGTVFNVVELAPVEEKASDTEEKKAGGRRGRSAAKKDEQAEDTPTP